VGRGAEEEGNALGNRQQTPVTPVRSAETRSREQIGSIYLPAFTRHQSGWTNSRVNYTSLSRLPS
jgi:hypothetical protein